MRLYGICKSEGKCICGLCSGIPDPESLRLGNKPDTDTRPMFRLCCSKFIPNPDPCPTCGAKMITIKGTAQ